MPLFLPLNAATARSLYFTAQGAICWSKVESSESLRLMYKRQDHSAWESKSQARLAWAGSPRALPLNQAVNSHLSLIHI